VTETTVVFYHLREKGPNERASKNSGCTDNKSVSDGLVSTGETFLGEYAQKNAADIAIEKASGVEGTEGRSATFGEAQKGKPRRRPSETGSERRRKITKSGIGGGKKYRITRKYGCPKERPQVPTVQVMNRRGRPDGQKVEKCRGDESRENSAYGTPRRADGA